MHYLSNAAVNRLTIFNGLMMLAWNFAGNFFLVFLLTRGFSPVAIFLAFAAQLGARLVLRPLVLLVTPRLGAGGALVLGNSLMALQYIVLARVDGLGFAFFLYCVVQALADSFYWTAYHAVYAHMGDDDHRGKQLGVRQALTILTGVLGPLAGGFAMDHFGAGVTFGLAAIIQTLALFPLLGLPKLAFARKAPHGAFKAGLSPAPFFFSDSWINLTLTLAWGIFLFGAAQKSFSSFGGAMALAGLVSGVGVLVLGRLIDNGHGHRATMLSGFLMAVDVVIRMVSGRGFATMCGVTAFGALLNTFYMPTLMTAFYNKVGNTPCPFRCMVVCESGWDLGGISASLLAAGLLTLGVPFWGVFAATLLGVGFQMMLLVRYYKNLPSLMIPQIP